MQFVLAHKHQSSAYILVFAHTSSQRNPVRLNIYLSKMGETQRSTTSPPPYTTQDGASSPAPKQYPIPADIKPSNYIQILTVDAVRGVWTIDPGLTPPASLMSPPQGKEDRKNVLIESQDGNINVDLFVLPSPNLEQSKVSLKLNSWSGSACIRVVRRGVSYVHRTGAYLR